ncbi:hypothetical protein Tco_1504545 [Tanacetum coccineum]
MHVPDQSLSKTLSDSFFYGQEERVRLLGAFNTLNLFSRIIIRLQINPPRSSSNAECSTATLLDKITDAIVSSYGPSVQFPPASIITFGIVRDMYKCCTMSFARRPASHIHEARVFHDPTGKYLCFNLTSSRCVFRLPWGFLIFTKGVEVYYDTAERPWNDTRMPGKEVGEGSRIGAREDPQGMDKGKAGIGETQGALGEGINQETRFGVKLESNMDEDNAEIGSMTGSNDFEVIV